MWCKIGVSESSQVKNIARAVLASGVHAYGLETRESIGFLGEILTGGAKKK